MYGAQMNDVYSSIAAIFRQTDPAKQQELVRDLRERIVPQNLQAAERRIEQSGSGFLVGNSVSWADFYLVTNLEYLGEERDSLLSRFPQVLALDRFIRSIPSISNWIRNRPPTDRLL